jgi:hypothetical protein
MYLHEKSKILGLRGFWGGHQIDVGNAAFRPIDAYFILGISFWIFENENPITKIWNEIPKFM